MTDKEARVRCMLEDKGGWPLSDEDRAAIAWLIAAWESAVADKDDAWSRLAKNIREQRELEKKVQTAFAPFKDLINRAF
jgi:hypothetical protein